jgi:hypothetical protein
MVLRRYLDLREGKKQEAEEKSIMRNSMIFTSHKILTG